MHVYIYIISIILVVFVPLLLSDMIWNFKPPKTIQTKGPNHPRIPIFIRHLQKYIISQVAISQAPSRPYIRPWCHRSFGPHRPKACWRFREWRLTISQKMQPWCCPKWDQLPISRQFHRGKMVNRPLDVVRDYVQTNPTMEAQCSWWLGQDVLLLVESGQTCCGNVAGWKMDIYEHHHKTWRHMKTLWMCATLICQLGLPKCTWPNCQLFCANHLSKPCR